MSGPELAGRVIALTETEVKLVFPNTPLGHKHRRAAEEGFENAGYKLQLIVMHKMGIEVIFHRPVE
jgi:hypothetical protein